MRSREWPTLKDSGSLATFAIGKMGKSSSAISRIALLLLMSDAQSLRECFSLLRPCSSSQTKLWTIEMTKHRPTSAASTDYKATFSTENKESLLWFQDKKRTLRKGLKWTSAEKRRKWIKFWRPFLQRRQEALANKEESGSTKRNRTSQNSELKTWFLLPNRQPELPGSPRNPIKLRLSKKARESERSQATLTYPVWTRSSTRCKAPRLCKTSLKTWWACGRPCKMASH